MSLKRWPPLLLVAALAAAAIAHDQRAGDGRSSPEPLEVDAAPTMPTARPVSALQSTWYCPGGGDPEAVTSHTVVIANPGREPVDGTITVFGPAGDDGAPRRQAPSPISVPAEGRLAVDLADRLAPPSAAALVETEGGGVVVEHDLAGPLGADAGPCATEPSDRWHFADGATAPGAAEDLVFFNPFLHDAVVDVVFFAEDGRRAPRTFNPLIVPAGSVRSVPVTEAVTVRERISASVRVRDGRRIVVERLQRFDGTGARRGGIVPEGLTVSLGTPRPVPRWYFPDGRRVEGFHSELVLYNPSDDEAELDVTLQLDDPARDGTIEPFEVSVAPRGTSVLDLDGEDRVPEELAHAVEVQSVNGVGVVAERLVVGDEPYVGRGVALTPGATATAERWVFAIGRATDRIDERLILQNPDRRPVAVRISALAGGRVPIVSDEASTEPFTVPAGGRLAVRLSRLVDRDALSLLIEADAPVVAERLLHRHERGTSHAIGVPLTP